MNETWATGNLEHWLRPTADPAWHLREIGYDRTREADIETCFAIGNGLLGVRASRAISRGPTWVTYQKHLTWASWPRTYVAGLFDTPNVLPPVPSLVPTPDWLRLRIWVNDELVSLSCGHLQKHQRTLDIRLGLLLTEWEQRLPAHHVVSVRTLRMVSLAERALALQLLRLKIDGDAAKVRLEASFEQAGSTLELVRVEHGAALWRTAESGKTLAIAARARLDVDRQFLSKETSELKWTWTWQQESGQVADFIRLSAFAKGGENEDDTQRRAAHAITQAEAAGWRAVLTAHEQAWMERWRLADIEIAGDANFSRHCGSRSIISIAPSIPTTTTSRLALAR